jgi:glucokinase
LYDIFTIMKKLVIGLDLGGTKIAAAIADQKGKIIRRLVVPTEAQKGKEAVIKNIFASIKNVAQNNLASVKAIGIGAPGPILYKEGIIVSPPNLPGWKKVPLRKIIQDEFKIKTILENDANAAALGEARFGAGRGIKNLIYITISTGIGGGVIIDGKIFRGAVGTAGEIGHTTIDPDGPRCGCGNYGCLEALASGTAIAQKAGKDATEVGKAARQGDKEALKIIRETGEYIGIGVANLANLFNPEMVIIGGGVANLGEMLFKPIRETVKKRALEVPASILKIVPAKLGSDAGVLGAVALCLRGDE